MDLESAVRLVNTIANIGTAILLIWMIKKIDRIGKR